MELTDTMLKRTVSMNWTERHYRKAIEIMGRDGFPYSGGEKLQRAIGYLSDWGRLSERYAHVDIALFATEHDFELTATYRPEPGGEIAFLMAGIWHKERKVFTFHS